MTVTVPTAVIELRAVEPESLRSAQSMRVQALLADTGARCLPVSASCAFISYESVRELAKEARLEHNVRSGARLIWNDPLSSPDLSTMAWQLPSKRQLAHISAYDHVVGAVSRGAEGAARRARSPGDRVRHVVPRRVGARAAETTDARGRFDDESR